MHINPVSMNFSANKISKTQAKYFKDKLKNAKSVDIICHESTDRDSLNSAIAMQRYMNNLGVDSKIVISQELSKIGIHKPTFKYIESDKIKDSDKPKDMILCVDFSSKERIKPSVLNYIQKSDNLLCIDHHQGSNLISDDYLLLKKPLENADEKIESSVPCYIDSSAKSATSVVYRLFEALDENITSEQAYSLMFGFADDSCNKGYVICDGIKGEIIPTKKLTDDKNAYEVFCKLKEKLDDEQIKKIAKAIDVMSNLSKEEEEFRESLYKRLQFSKNRKIAYVEIPPNDEQWHKLGGDNNRTSTILNRFRKDILNKYDEAELAIVFYESEDKYRLSAHSKNNTLLNFYNYIADTTFPNLTKNAGGHADRGGGKIYTTNPELCHIWAEGVVACEDFYDKPSASLQN